MDDKMTTILFATPDDNDNEAFEEFIIREKLRYSCTFINSITKVADTLKECEFDVVILECGQNSEINFEILKTHRHIPILFMAQAGNEAMIANLLQAGATDYLIKDPDKNYLKLLPQIIQRAIRYKKMEEEQLFSQKAVDTEIKIVEQQLRTSEERFRLLTEKASDMICLHELDGRYLYVSPSSERLLGYRPDELIGQDPYKNFHPRDLQRVQRESHKKALYGMEILQITYRIRHRNGNYIWFETYTQPIFDEQGQVVRLLTTSRDITERKQAEEMLRNIAEGVSAETGEAFLGSLVEYLAKTFKVNYAFIGELEKESYMIRTSVVFADNQLIDNFEYNLKGTPCANVVNDQQICIYSANVQQQFPQDQMLVDLGVESYAGIPISDLDGTVIGLMTILDNKPLVNKHLVSWMLKIFAARVSAELERIKMVEVLKAERALLSKRVAARTTELVAANAELARAARLKDEFLANMSHELRTPLNAILGISEALQYGVYGSMNERQDKALGIIESSGRHLLELISDILDLAKVESGKMDLTVSQVSIKSVCQTSLEFVRQTALRKKIEIVFSSDSFANTIHADERRLKQILVNLLSNAVKFTAEKGQVGLEVSDDPEKEVLRFAVWDTGIGISPKDQKNLFTPFVQLDSGLSRAHQGTGLGLSLVQRLIKMHGGSVLLESEVGKGSCFTVLLPRHNGNGQIKNRNFGELNKSGKKNSSNSQVSSFYPLILLAEDNEANIFALTDYLQTQGCKIVTAKNGLETVELARQTQPDLVLLDIQMPVIDGLEVIKIIRADKALHGMPIIALTALAMSGDRERCLTAGADEYMSKPVNLKKLMSLVQTYVK